jgi:hypothetical protein
MSCIPSSSSLAMLPSSESHSALHQILSDLHLSQCLISLIRGRVSSASQILQSLSKCHQNLSSLQRSFFSTLTQLCDLLSLTKTSKFALLFPTSSVSRKRKKENQKTIFNVAQPLLQAFESLKSMDYLHSIQSLQHGYLFLTHQTQSTLLSSSLSSSASHSQSQSNSPMHHLLLHIYRNLLSSFHLLQGNRKKSLEVLSSHSSFKAEKSSSLHQLLTFKITTWFSFFQGDLPHCQQLIASFSSSSAVTSSSLSHGPNSSSHLSIRFFTAMISLCSSVSDLLSPSSSSSPSSPSSSHLLNEEFKLQCREHLSTLLYAGQKYLEQTLGSSFTPSPLVILSLYFTAYTSLFLLSHSDSFLVHVTHQGGGFMTRLEDLSNKILHWFREISSSLPILRLFYHSLAYKWCTVHQKNNNRTQTRSVSLTHWIQSSEEYDLRQLLQFQSEISNEELCLLPSLTTVTTTKFSVSQSTSNKNGFKGGFTFCYLLYSLERRRYDLETMRDEMKFVDTSTMNLQINLLLEHFGLKNCCKNLTGSVASPSSGHILFDLSFLQTSQPLPPSH